MADLEQFATAKFDAVAYVNDLCKAAPAGVSLERHLTDVELRLQLASDDVTGKLEDASVRAAQRVPALLQELLRIQGDLATAQEAMGEMRSAVAQSSSSPGARAVDRLAALEGVKGRMQAAADALEEASGLASLFHRVDALFEDRDLPAIAEALAGMQRGLAVVGGRAPGVADGPARLTALRARFAAMLQAPLSEALRERRATEAVALSAWLEAAGDAQSVARQYCNELQAPLLRLWGAAAPPAFVGWLPQFFDGVAALAQAEAAWLRPALPARAAALLCAALGTFFEDIAPGFKSRLDGALAAPVGSTVPLDRLAAAYSAAAEFLDRVRPAILLEKDLDASSLDASASESEAFARVARAVLAPLEEALVGRYGRLEGAALEAEARRAVGVLGAVGGDKSGDLAAALVSSARGLCVAAHAALRRCGELTGGTLLPALVPVADDAARHYLVAARGALSARLAAAQRDGSVDEAGAAAALQLAAPLAPAAAGVRARLAALDAAFASAAAEGGAADERPSAASGGRYDASAARLERDPELRARLAALRARCEAPGAGRCLAQAAAGAAALEKLVEESVVAIALARTRELLARLAAAPEYAAATPVPAGGAALPIFSAIPLSAVTTVGEHLLLLPQVLESALLGEEGGEAAASPHASQEDSLGAVTDWTVRIAAEAAADLVRLALRPLPRLSGAGAAQLAADLEYFCNVLGSLGVEIPDELGAWAAAAAAPDAAAAAALLREAGSPAARQVVRRVVALRGWSEAAIGA